PWRLATSATLSLSASRRIRTICSSLYRVFFICLSLSERPLSQVTLDRKSRDRSDGRSPTSSDQGWHYRMQPYKAALARYGMKQSMSRKGNCFDNAAMESFFATLKAEYFHLSDFDDIEQLNAGLRRYI